MNKNRQKITKPTNWNLLSGQTYCSKNYTAALPSGGKYHELPRTVVITIIKNPLFNCKEFHSEFVPLERKHVIIMADTF